MIWLVLLLLAACERTTEAASAKDVRSVTRDVGRTVAAGQTEAAEMEEYGPTTTTIEEFAPPAPPPPGAGVPAGEAGTVPSGGPPRLTRRVTIRQDSIGPAGPAVRVGQTVDVAARTEEAHQTTQATSTREEAHRDTATRGGPSPLAWLGLGFTLAVALVVGWRLLRPRL